MFSPPWFSLIFVVLQHAVCVGTCCMSTSAAPPPTSHPPRFPQARSSPVQSTSMTAWANVWLASSNNQTEVRSQINSTNYQLSPSEGKSGVEWVGGCYSQVFRGTGKGGWWLKFQCALHTLNPSLLSFPFHLRAFKWTHTHTHTDSDPRILFCRGCQFLAVTSAWISHLITEVGNCKCCFQDLVLFKRVESVFYVFI